MTCKRCSGIWESINWQRNESLCRFDDTEGVCSTRSAVAVRVCIGYSDGESDFNALTCQAHSSRNCNMAPLQQCSKADTSILRFAPASSVVETLVAVCAFCGVPLRLSDASAQVCVSSQCLNKQRYWSPDAVSSIALSPLLMDAVSHAKSGLYRCGSPCNTALLVQIAADGVMAAHRVVGS